MTLKRIYIEASKFSEFATSCTHTEDFVDASRVYRVEHPEHGETILILRTDGSATAFADQVRFLEDGSASG